MATRITALNLLARAADSYRPGYQGTARELLLDAHKASGTPRRVWEAAVIAIGWCCDARGAKAHEVLTEATKSLAPGAGVVG